jgi:exopolyphosphatase/guanosine-5'-triphosphate,3'-diphosphate pyrophosphatase
VLCETALREGLIYDYVAQHRPEVQLIDDIPDPRRRSVVQLARRCGVNQAHAEQVARLALDLFRGTRALHGLPNSDGELLEFAAMLHDVGFHIASSKHHKHAAYLIANTDMRGFTTDEIALLSQVARYHRKSVPKEAHEPYGKLPETLKQRIRLLAGLVRVADGLDRGYVQRVKSARVRLPGGERVPEKPGDRRGAVEVVIRSEGDPDLELWGARRKADLLEEVLGRKVRFVVDRGLAEGAST